MIGERIKELRKELSISQIEFAEYLEMKQNTLSGYEKRGKIPSDLLETIILKTGVNPDWLLTGKGGYIFYFGTPEGREGKNIGFRITKYP